MCIIVYTTIDKVVFLTFQPLKHNTVHFGGVVVIVEFLCVYIQRKRSYMYNFKIAQLHIQGCEEGLFFLNHSSCNSPMVGKIFLGRGRGGKIRAGEGVPSVCNFYGCCWFKDCIFIMIFLINLITAL